MGLPVYIYRSTYDSKLNAFFGKTLITVTNVNGPFEPSEDAPAGKLVQHAGNWIIVPDDDYTEELGPQLPGGTYATTTDSRWSNKVGFYGATPIHDRRETWEDYEALSR
tara:strand:+ start:252 stop:578 length:327 start_codon:yes stop_codon:yes gene_type:complete